MVIRWRGEADDGKKEKGEVDRAALLMYFIVEVVRFAESDMSRLDSTITLPCPCLDQLRSA